MLRADDRNNQDKPPGLSTCGDIGKTLSGDSYSELTVDRALDLAFSHYNIGRLSEAERLCRLVLDKVPRQVDAMQLLGVILSQTGRCTEAVQLLRKAISQAPGHAQLYNNLGVALHRLGKPDEAVSQFNRALQIRPDFAKAYNNLGAALIELGRVDEAVIACAEAIRLQGDLKQAHNNLGLALKKKAAISSCGAGSLQDAAASFEKAIALDPEYAEALSNLGMVLIAQGKLKEAADNLQKAVSLAPSSAEFRNNLGVLLNREGRFDEAVAASEKAIDLRPDYVEAHNNLGTALMELGRFAEANAAFEKAIGIDPECAQAHHNRSLVLLLTGQFEQGWEQYEWRWKHSGFSTPIRPFPQQWWDDAAEGVGKLLVWGEQGIGDEVQFSGLIRHIISRGIDVVVECDRRLVPLLARSFAGTTVVPRRDPPAPLLEDPSITHQIPMASIPRVLGLFPSSGRRPLPERGSSMPFQNPFMIPDIKQRDQFRGEYLRKIRNSRFEIPNLSRAKAAPRETEGSRDSLDPVLVGISWRSGNPQEGPKRSIPLEFWGPILRLPAACFVSLQYGRCSSELRAAYDRFGVEILEDKRIDSLTDLDGFAAQVAAMDLVISVDNSTVHFAGALGVQVWTMLPTVPDWRWGHQGERTRWYPSMRLFRQAERGKWEPVISKVAEELARRTAGRTSLV